MQEETIGRLDVQGAADAVWFRHDRKASAKLNRSIVESQQICFGLSVKNPHLLREKLNNIDRKKSMPCLAFKEGFKHAIENYSTSLLSDFGLVNNVAKDADQHVEHLQRIDGRPVHKEDEALSYFAILQI